VVTADAQPGGDPALEAAELFPHALAERLQLLEPVARPRGVDAVAVAIAMIDGHEHTDLTLLGGDGGGHVGPELVRAVGDDGPFMGSGPVGMPDPLRGLEALLGPVLSVGRWKGRRSALRPPPPRVEWTVGPAPLVQQLDVHGQLANLGPQPGDIVVPVVGRPALQRGLTTGQEVIAPAGERGGGDAELPGDEFLLAEPRRLSRPRSAMRTTRTRLRPAISRVPSLLVRTPSGLTWS
jgi:hypothetical protein